MNWHGPHAGEQFVSLAPGVGPRLQLLTRRIDSVERTIGNPLRSFAGEVAPDFNEVLVSFRRKVNLALTAWHVERERA